MTVLQIREALRAAIDEEMARDDRVFVMGEEVGHYDGAYKVSQGMLEEFGETPQALRDLSFAERRLADLDAALGVARQLGEARRGCCAKLARKPLGNMHPLTAHIRPGVPPERKCRRVVDEIDPDLLE